ncbi:sigma factor [Streptomyces nanshensis]|uniref:Uncharacterized protein n=1 Tax=Streptomyces nanshensis TaxID=518642 RepID=A0A1E7L207_9ACTN|nr:sigma factor [Streptomyces nanshensis]OEV10219.1 hypothetical protein AN218_18540 [Streptomyces nanshensis]
MQTTELDQMSLLVEAYDRYQPRLHRLVNNHLPPDQWHRGEDITQNVWMRALESADLDNTCVDSRSELPIWLVETAREEIAEHHRSTVEALYGSRPVNCTFHDVHTTVDKRIVLIPAEVLVDLDDFTKQQPEPQFALMAG